MTIPDQFNAAWASREWGVEGIVEEATARRWFDKGYREALDRVNALEAKCALLAASLVQEEARSRAIEAAAIERCAKVCDAKVFALDNGGKPYRREATASQCAEAIRALLKTDGEKS